jgi:hypothetical protein
VDRNDPLPSFRYSVLDDSVLDDSVLDDSVLDDSVLDVLVAQTVDAKKRRLLKARNSPKL